MVRQWLHGLPVYGGLGIFNATPSQRRILVVGGSVAGICLARVTKNSSYSSPIPRSISSLFLRLLVSGSHLLDVVLEYKIRYFLGDPSIQRYLVGPDSSETCGGPTGPVLGQVVDVSVVVQRQVLGSMVRKTVVVPQSQFIDGRRHPCLYAVADPHGPVCSENH